MDKDAKSDKREAGIPAACTILRSSAFKRIRKGGKVPCSAKPLRRA